MKYTAVLFILVVTAGLSRADLVIQQQGLGAGRTNIFTVTIGANKIREDVQVLGVGSSIGIHDMNTFDVITMNPERKAFKKFSGSIIREDIAKTRAQEGTNADATLSKPVDTGKSEKIGGYQCEIYKWSNGSRNLTNTLWVAKGYPHFETIRPYLVRVDQLHSRGMDNGMHPDLGGLPGMVVKTEWVVGNQPPVVITLISAKEAPANSSLFEVPNDFKESDQPWGQ